MNVPTLLTSHLPTLSEIGNWVLSSGLPVLLSVLLVAPVTAALTLRRQKQQRSNAMKVGGDLLLRDWTRVVKRTAMGFVHLGNALTSAQQHSLLSIIHEASGRGMTYGNMTLEQMEGYSRTNDATFETFKTHLSWAEREFSDAQAAYGHFLQQSTVFASAVDPEELARLMVIQGDAGQALESIGSLVYAIRAAMHCEPISEIVIFDHVEANDHVSKFLAEFGRNQPKDSWVVRTVDRLLSKQVKILEKFEHATSQKVYLGVPPPDLSDEWVKDATARLAIPQKVLPDLQKQRGYAEQLASQPMSQYRIWSEDFSKWKHQLAYDGAPV
ncbi:hypothetical protein ABH945_004493 [Paraburkholderia sp. GAS333]|uniref:hypothetical protein n=1 Tax=Paraburkholderia sp. GAS333 TaxID=3156279 RepID=UPI003D1C537F